MTCDSGLATRDFCMQFASPLPWWLAALVAIGIGGIAYLSYRRPLVPLTQPQRAILIALRTLALAAVAIFVCRPVMLLPAAPSGDVVVPVLVDVSRSMRIADADGGTRINRARDLVEKTLVPGLAGHATIDVLAFGDSLAPATADHLTADARRTDLNRALAAARDRYRGRAVPAIVVVSDGGDTEQSSRSQTESTEPAHGPPVYAIGVGAPDGLPDREITGITAGEPRLDQTSIDLYVAAVSRGFGRAPFTVRLLANGQTIDSHKVVPLTSGSPINETFIVSPNPLNPTVYTAEIAAEPGEAVTENNSRSVLVSPAGRKRRVLTIAGAPGFEHSFLTRALGMDPGLEIDSVVRKGKNEESADTFLVQAGGGRAQALLAGFPATREALFGYDALVIANIEGDFFTRAQLSLASDFVAERGGGLLVLGGRSFEQRGLIGTPLEAALPVELNDRRGTVRRAATEEAPVPQNHLALTPEGESHPVMRIGASPDTTRKIWSSFPALAASASVGGPRPGASVLAVTTTPSGVVLPVIAVQRFGRGRSMVFAGEASWRWKMLQASTDRSYEFFWRQALRWLTTEAPDSVSLTLPSEIEPGDAMTVELDARDRSFEPVADASVSATLTAPGGETRPLPMRPGGKGKFVAAETLDNAGLYHVHAAAKRGAAALGDADRWFYVGGSDREFADPRLNEGLLRRLARESGGKYVRAAEAGQIVPALNSTAPRTAEPQRRDLWHEPWAFALVIGLLSAEWVLRRRWGLR
jgi:uncharacterized membrane protein